MSLSGLATRGADASSRWLLLGSLALNLFFVGIAGAYLTQSYWLSGAEAPIAIDRSIAARIGRIADTLPREDRDRLRRAFDAQRADIESARAAYDQRREQIHVALRAQPFDEAALRNAMAEARTARQAFDRRIQDFFAEQAAEMSAAGRRKLADWRGSRRSGEQNTGMESSHR